MSRKALHSRLGESLRSSRRELPMTQREMASRIHCSIPTLRLLESGSGILANFAKAAAEMGLCLDGDALPGGEGVGQSLSVLRRRRGISRRELSRRSGVSVPTLTSLERGDDCRLEKLVEVSSKLGVSLRLRRSDTPRTFYSTVSKSSAHEKWTTPAEFLERLYPVVGGRFSLDPCSPTRTRSKAPVRADDYYTEEDDGLALGWRGTVFMNPPYGRAAIRNWVAKARSEVEQGHAQAVYALLPARTETRWWSDFVRGVADIWLLVGRLRFGGVDGSAAPFGSALIAWGLDDESRARVNEAFPTATYVAASNPKAGA